MYAFQTLLEKVHSALRSDGVLILRIPEPEDGTLQVWRAGECIFTTQTGEPVFSGYAATGKRVLRQFIAEDRFAGLGEGTHDFDYVYDSVDAWWNDVSAGCEDRPQLDELTARLRSIDDQSARARVSVRYKEWTILLRKR